MGKVIEAHSAIRQAKSPGGPTLSEKMPWTCDADASQSESTVHFNKPCDTFTSVTSSVGSGVANRFAGVFLLGGSSSPLHRLCREELMSEIATRFGESLLDQSKQLSQC